MLDSVVTGLADVKRYLEYAQKPLALRKERAGGGGSWMGTWVPIKTPIIDSEN
jgi:hypothetical protein